MAPMAAAAIARPRPVRGNRLIHATSSSPLSLVVVSQSPDEQRLTHSHIARSAAQAARAVAVP